MQEHHEPGGTQYPEEPNELQEPITPPKNRRNTYIIAIVLIVVAIIIANAFQDEAPSETNGVTISDSSSDIVVTIDDGTGLQELRFDLTDFFEGYSANEFQDLDEASLIINSTQGKPTSGDGSERIVSNIVNGDEEDMVYFATKSYDDELQENFVGIYHYNVVNNRWQRVYKDTMSNDSLHAPFLRVLARTGDYLILLKDFDDNSPGACANLWLMGEEEPFELLLLNLADPYAGFAQFPLPESLRGLEEAEVEDCLANN